MDVENGDGAITLASYPNVTDPIGAIIGAELATLHELNTVYGAEDVYDMIEVLNVRAYNRRLIDEAARMDQT